MPERIPRSGKLSLEAEDLAVYKIRHQQQQARSNVFTALMFVLLIACVGAASFGGYYYLNQQQQLVSDLQAEMQQLQNQLAVTSTEGTERDVSTLSSVHETKRQVTQLANQVKAQLETYNENNRIRIDAATNPIKVEINAQKQEIDNLDAAITELEGISQALSNDIASSSSALSQGFFDEIERAQLNMAESVKRSDDRLRAQIEVIDQQQDRVVEVLGSLQENQQRLGNQIAALNNDVQTVRALLDTEEADFASAIESLNRFRTQTNGSVTDLRRLVTDINTRLTRTEQQLATPVNTGGSTVAIPAPQDQASVASPEAARAPGPQ